ncbi:MAG: rod shape-determining protein MreD [Lachnospiraceae bacterium]|nr:rod shape-determining protein MreD [Lachnospiraceae bacterium]MCR5777229.1 rod shape-determining protein MreD [Lachnospiraceae bacterium]
MKRKIIELILIFVCFILQCTFFKAIALGGIVPNLLVIITASFGLMHGQKEGMYVGFISGLLTDIMFGNGIIGLYALIYVFVGYFNGLLSRIFYPEDIKLPLFLITISDFLYCFICYILTFLLRSRLDLGYYLIHIIFPEMIFTVLITLVVYKGILNLETWIEETEDEEN